MLYLIDQIQIHRKVHAMPTPNFLFNRVFQTPPKAEQFSPKFHGLIDAKGIDVALPIWLRYLTKILYFRHFITFWIEWIANLSTNC